MRRTAVLSIAVIIASIGLYLIFIKSSGRTEAISMCIELCMNYEGNRTDGPCLSNGTAKGWVCDIAHYPRYWSDNKEENQCPAYVEGNASHFVEVDENCTLIRAL